MNDENRPEAASEHPAKDAELKDSGPCPDCAQVFDQRKHLTHEETCPLGRAIDVVTAADREWFERHPGTDRRRRLITPTEIQEFGHLGHDVGPTWLWVIKVSDGVRIRSTRPIGHLSVEDIRRDVLGSAS